MIDIYKRWPASVKSPNGFAREPIPELSEYMSFSRLSKFRKSPKHYEWRYIKGNEDPDTPAKKEGKALHKAILETEDFLKRLKVKPDASEYDNPTKEGLVKYAEERGIKVVKSWTKRKIIQALLDTEPEFRSVLYDCVLADFEAGLGENDLVVTTEQAKRYVEVIRSVSSHPNAHKLLTGGTPEVVAYYWDEEFGVLWRAAIDYLTIGKSMAWVTEVKTTGDASPNRFPKDIDDYGYYIQNWIYHRIVSGITGLPTQVVQIPVEKNPPFVCETYIHGERTIEAANWEISRLIERFKQCQRSNIWPGYTDGRIQTVDLPNYSIYRMEEQAEKELHQ